MWKRQNRGLGQTPNKTGTHGFNSNLRGRDNNRGRGGGRDNNRGRGGGRDNNRGRVGGNLNTGRINSQVDKCNRALPEHNVGNRDMHDARYDNNSGQDSFYIDRERRDEFQDPDQSRLFKHPGDGEYHFERRDNVGQEFYDDYNRRGNEYEQKQPEFRHDQYREVDAPKISDYRNEYSNEQVRQHDDGFQRQEYRGQEFDQVQSTDLREKISSGNFRGNEFPNVRARESSTNVRARELSANVRARQSSANVRARQSSANVRTRVSSANVRPRESAASSRGRAISANTGHSQSSAIVRRGSTSSTRDTNKSRSSERSRSKHGPNERRNVDKRSSSKQDFDKRNNSSHSSKNSKHSKREVGNSQRSSNRSNEQSGHLDDKSRHDKPRVNVKKGGQSRGSKTSISLSRNSSTDPKRVNVENKITSTRSSNLKSGKDSSTSTRSNIKKEPEVKSVKGEANIKKERERKESNVSTKSRSLDRKQNRASRQKSNHSAERNAEVSKDHGYYHEDDIISILADDDRFDRETKRYVSNEPVTVNVSILDKRNRSRERKNDHDSNLDTDPFQIHAESSSSVFDDVNISSIGNKGREGTFQVPKRVHEHTSSSKRSLSRDKQNRNNTTSRAPRQQSSRVKDSVRNSKVFTKVISGKTSSIYRRPFSSKTVGSFKKPTLSRTNLKPKVGHIASINRVRSNTTQKFINQEIGRTGAVLKEDRENNVRHDNSSFIRDDKTDFRRETEIYREEDNYRRENVDNFRQTNEENYRREAVDDLRQTNEEKYRRENVDDLRQVVRVNDEFNREGNNYNVGDDIRGAEHDEGRYAGDNEQYRWDDSHMGDYRTGYDDFRRDGEGSRVVADTRGDFRRDGEESRAVGETRGIFRRDGEGSRVVADTRGDFHRDGEGFRAVGDTRGDLLRDGEGSRATRDTRGDFRRDGEESRAVGETRDDFRRDGEGSRVVADTRGDFHRDGEGFRAVGDTRGDLHRDGEGSRAARDTRGDFRRDGEGARAVGDARREETYWQGEDYERDGYRQDEPLNRDGKFNQNNYKGSVSRYSGERRGIEERNQYKVPRNTQYDRFKKKYFSNRYGNNKRSFGNIGSRKKDDQDKDRSRDRSKGRHQGDASSPVNPDLNLQPIDSNQQVIFIPNTDFGGHPQLLDQYGNVVINPINQELDVHQGETPIPLQFAPPNMPPEVPPGEQLIFIPFNQLTQQQGFSENTVSLPFGTEGKLVGGAHFQNNVPLDRNINQAENGKDVAKPAKKPLTNQQRAQLRRRLYLKQKQRLEKRVEERLLKKLLGQTNDLNVDARSHSIISKAKPILKKITAPGEGSSHVNKQIRLTRGTNKRADLDDVSDDEENKYDQVSDLEDVTDDENYEAGGKVAKGGVSSGKRPTFRKPGEPRINSSRKRQASKNPSSLNSNNQFMRPQNTDIRKVVDRNHCVNSDKNRRINIVSNKGVRIEKEQAYGRKRSSPVTEHTTEKKMRTMDKDKKFEHSDEKQSKSTAQRREKIYEKRPISPLQITVSNERFAKKDTAEQLYPVYKTVNESHQNFKENARHDKSIEYSKSHEQYHDSRYQFKDLEKGNDKHTISKTDGRNTGSYERNKKQDIVVQERRDSFNERQKRQDSATHERSDSFNERHKNHDSAIHERRDSVNRKRDSDERNVKNDGKYDSRMVKEDRKIETDKNMFENRRNYSQQPGSLGKDNRKGNNYNKKLDERVDRDYRKDERDSGRSRSNDRHDIDQRKERRETNSYRDNHKKSDDKYRHKQDSDKAKRSYQPSQGRSSSTNKRGRSPDKKLSVHEKLHQNTSQQSQSASHPEQTFQQVQGHFNTSQSQQFAILQHPNVQFLNTNSQNDPSLPPMAINQLPMNMPPVPPSSLGVRPDMSMPPPHVQLMGNSQQIVYQQQPVQQQQQFSQPIQQTVLQPLQQQQLQQLQSQQFQQQPQQFQQQQLQQQQQLPMNSNQQFQGGNTTGLNSAVFQTGIQCMTSSQQNIGGSPIFAIQSNQQNQSQGNQFHQQQQSGMNSGMMQLDPSQPQGQFQNSQTSNQSMPLMSNQQQGTSQQNFQQQISSSPSSYVAGTPQQAMKGVLRSVGPGQSSNSGGVLKTPAIPSLRSTFQNQMKGSQGILKLPQGTLQYASQEQSNNQSNNNMIMGTNATLAKTPTHYEAQAGISKTTGHQNWQDDEEEEDDIPELLCTKCDKVFMCDSVMRKHGMWHNQMESGIIDLRCDNCEQAFMSNGALNRHISEKHSVDSWNCSMCDITFTNSNALSKHMRTTMHRPLGNKFSCSQCKATFKLLKQLILHKTDIHPQGGAPSYSSNIRRY